jgi:uncharacterized protein (DUF486 family)
MTEFVLTFLGWFALNVLIGLTMDFAMFSQTTPEMKHASILEKILTTEFWATIEWMFLIPSQRIGNTFLNPAQLAMSSYVFDFLAQLWSNTFWLNLPTSMDDYLGMALILFGMYAAKFKLFEKSK